MFCDITPDRHCMIMLAVKCTIYKFHLRDLIINKKLQLFFYKFNIAESKFLINRRKTVTAGKGAASAAFIINDSVFKLFKILICKRNFTEIHQFSPSCMYDIRNFVLISESHSSDFFQIFRFSFYIMACQFLKSLFAFSDHYTRKSRITSQKLLRVIRHLRTSCPEICIREDLLQIRNQFFYKRHIPDIAGKANDIRLFQIDIFQDLIPDLIDRIFLDYNLRTVFTRTGF